MIARMLCLFLLLSVAHASAATDMEDWPVRVLSFAYLQNNGLISEDALEGDGPAAALFQEKYGDLAKLFGQHEKNYPAGLLPWLRRYCWIRWQPGFTCGEMQARATQEEGFLYVSDPVPGERPFLVIIMSNVSPRYTEIYRLFEDELEIVYDRIQHNQLVCGLTDPGTGLFLTYNAEISADGQLILYETEGFHWDKLPRRQFALNLTQDTCSLKLLKETIPFLEQE